MADGELIFDTKVDTDSFEKGIKDIKAKLKNISTSVESISTTTKKAFDGMSSAQIGLVNSLDQTKKKIAELKNKIEEIENVKVPTEKYTKLQEKVQELKNEYKALITEQSRQKSFTSYNANSAEAKALDEQIKQVRMSLNKSSIQLNNLKTSGGGFEAQGTTAESAGLREKLNVEESKFIKLNKQLEELNQKEENATKSAGKLKNALNSIGKGAKSFGSKISSAFKKSDNPVKKFTKKLTSIGTMLKARVIRGLVTGITSGIKNGFNNLVQYSSKVNKSISGLKSSFTQLNNALATAFMPILKKIAPVIQNIINKIIEAINVVAQFTSRLFSNSTTFTKAKKINEDYAKSLSNTNKEQKKAFSFDTIEKLDSKNNDGSVSPSEMFEEANIESGVLNFTDNIKNSIANGDWRNVGSMFAEKVNSIFNSVDFGAIGTKIGTKFNNIISTMCGFYAKFDWKGAGKKLSDLINSLFATINWVQIGELITVKAVGVLEAFTSFFRNTDWAAIGDDIWVFFSSIDWGKIVSNMATAFASFLGGFSRLVIQALIINPAQDLANYFYEKMQECGGNAWEGFCKGIVDWLYNLGKFIVEDMWKPFKEAFCDAFGIHSPSTKMAEFGRYIVDGLLNGITEKWENLKNSVKDLCSNFVSGIKNFFGIHSPSTVFANIGENITAGVEEGIGDGNGAFDGLNSLSADSVENMKTAWSGIGEWFSTNVTNPLNGVFKVFENDLNGIFDNILSNVKNTVIMSINMMNIMIESLESTMDNVVRAVNRIISSINATSSETGISLPYAKNEKFTRIQIPKLATGTVVPANYGEFAAILGDNKRETEVVSPLSTMKQALIEALAESGGQNITIKFEESSIGDLVRILKPYIDKENRRIGTSTRITGGAY